MNKYSKKIEIVSKRLDALGTAISVGKITRRDMCKTIAAAEQTLHIQGNAMRRDLWSVRESNSLVLSWENEDAIDQLNRLREVIEDGDITEGKVVAELRSVGLHLQEMTRVNGKPMPSKAEQTAKAKKTIKAWTGKQITVRVKVKKNAIDKQFGGKM